MKEKRIYIVMDWQLDRNINEVADEEFIDLAEQNGNVYSLDGFVNQWNNDFTLPCNDCSFIRIIDVEL